MKTLARHRMSETNMTLQRLARRLIAAFLATFLVLLGTSGAVLAHDAVTGTTPANGSTVTVMPETIEISMSNTPATLGSQVLVLDQAGNNWAQEDVTVLDTVASQALRPGAPAGTYTVKWRLVSSDSHPVEGEFNFTAAAAGSAPAVAAQTNAAVGAGPVTSVSAVPEAATDPVADTSAVPWSIIALIVVLAGLVVAMMVVARRRLSRED